MKIFKNYYINKINYTKFKRIYYRICIIKSNFNGDISKWNVYKVKNMKQMLKFSKFNGDISKWDVSNVKNINDAFDNCPIKDNYEPKFK